MEEMTAGFAAWVAETLEKIIAHYTPYFVFEHNVQFAGEQLALVAQMHNQQQGAIMGFRISQMGPQASEYIFVLREDVFDSTCFARVEALLSEAQREYVKPDPNQAYTILSAIILASCIDAQAEAALKRHKPRGSDKGLNGMGWSFARIAVVGQEGRVISDRNGTDLCALMQRALGTGR